MDFHLHDAPTKPPTVPDIDFRSELNDDQYEAVTAEPGPSLVLAGAGSGKTRTLTYRVAFLLHKGVPPGNILLLTFTNKAAREMLHRVEDLTGVEARRFWGGTFHHIGQKILRRHGEAVGLGKNFTILDAGEAESLLNETVKEKDPLFFKDKTHPRSRVLSDMFGMARNTRLSIPEAIDRYFPGHSEIAERCAVFYPLYQQKKLEQQVVDYDDLLDFPLKLLRENEELLLHYQERFRHVLVDEYQDTNRIQSEIVDTFGAHHQIMAVGDDAQCIYSWRGADFHNILSFPERHPDTRIYKIEVNYRSTPEILAFANGVLSHRPVHAGFHKELRPARGHSMRPYFVPAMDGREQALFIMKRLEGLLDEGYRLSDVAVLYRAHYHSLELQMELSRAGIPFQITSGVRFFEQAHVRDLTAQLRFACNPRDGTSFKRVAALLPKIGDKTAAKLLALANKAATGGNTSVAKALLDESVLKKVPAAAAEEWSKLMWTIHDMAEARKNRTPAEIVQLGIDGWYGDYLRGAYSNYSQRLDDLKGLVGFAGRFEEMEELLAQLVLLSSETSDRSVDGDEDQLRLTTVHQAKGLEFPVVFLIGVAEGLFPLRRTLEEGGDVEEERRLFYVAVTRAKDQLYLCQPKITRAGGPAFIMKPSQFLAVVPESLYEIIRLQRQSYW